LTFDQFFDEFASSPGNTIYFTVYVFLDDFSTISENTINSGATSGASSEDYGIRISKGGYDVKTCDDIDCVLSSSFFNNIVHKKGMGTTSGGWSLTVSHNLGYEPSAIAFSEVSGESQIQYAGDLRISSSDIYINVYEEGLDVYYIIFKSKLT